MKSWIVNTGNTPVIATAIHDGHEVRSELADLYGINESDRLREEDPFTGEWATISDTHIIVKRSRFEIDLNRPRKKAVYISPEDAWGLQIWQTVPTVEMIAHSLQIYDDFYAELRQIIEHTIEKHGCFVLLDLHSYNHRRNGPNAEPESPKLNPEVNVGTGTITNNRWRSTIERFITGLSGYDLHGRHLDVRENIKFKGGQLSRWINDNFSEYGCALAIEFKKFFMDEWTGKPDHQMIGSIREALSDAMIDLVKKLNNEIENLD